MTNFDMIEMVRNEGIYFIVIFAREMFKSIEISLKQQYDVYY